MRCARCFRCWQGAAVWAHGHACALRVLPGSVGHHWCGYMHAQHADASADAIWNATACAVGVPAPPLCRMINMHDLCDGCCAFHQAPARALKSTALPSLRKKGKGPKNPNRTSGAGAGGATAGSGGATPATLDRARGRRPAHCGKPPGVVRTGGPRRNANAKALADVARSGSGKHTTGGGDGAGAADVSLGPGVGGAVREDGRARAQAMKRLGGAGDVGPERYRPATSCGPRAHVQLACPWRAHGVCAR